MNNEEIINILSHDKLKFKELLELYKNYLINTRSEEDRFSKYSDDFDYYYTNSIYTNCYAYALKLRIPLFFNNYFLNITGNYFSFIPGVFSGKSYPNTSKNLIDNVRSDLDCLKVKDYGYKLAVLSEIKASDGIKDFHFIRENIDGNWSHKLGFSAFINENWYIEVPDNYELVKILKI